MNRHAAWIRRPEDPVSAWRWLSSTGLRFKPEQRRLLIIVLSVLAGVSLALGISQAVPILLAIFLVATYFQPQSREHAALIDFSDGSTFPVSLTLVRNRKTTGRDVGWICFVDGWLVYEGMRTSFSITAKGPSTVMFNSLSVVLPDGQIARFGLLNDPRASRLSGLDTKGLRAAFEEWKLGAVPTGEPVYPPAAAHPTATAQKLKERLAWAAFLGLASTMGFKFPITWLFATFLFFAIVQLVLFAVNFARFRRELKTVFDPHRLPEPPNPPPALQSQPQHRQAV